MKKLYFILGFIFAATLLISSGVKAATTVCTVFNGCTGWGAIQSGTIPYGNGASALATTTAGTNGNVLGLQAGIPKWIASTTYSAGTGISVGFANNTLTITNSGVTSLGNGTGITCSGTAPGSCSIAAPVSVANGGTNSTSLTGDQILYTNHAGTSVLTVASSSLALPFSALPSVSANSVLGNSTSASAAATSIATSSLYTYSPGLTQASGLQKQVENRGFSYATTTTWTGTTTISLGVGYGEVWQNMKCYTDVGTLNMDFYHASSHLSPMFNASTTVGTVTNSANQTDTTGDKVSVDIGTPATSPTKIACTVQDIN